MFKAILTYFAVKQIVTFVVLTAMMIGLLAVVCVVAVFAPKADTNENTNENTNVTAVLSNSKRDTWEYTYFDSWKWENLRTLDVFGA
ncbi:MAG: hypothetical protein IJQ98_04325 [Oscillospiraceae bacterium]|nr:hypothetical protein [Oscillospiraceae bacterium]